MKPINSLPPFKRFCVTIGNLPSSYVDSMSYYECIMWLCKYLKDTVIPVVNENVEVVNELINWFNNLDVQEEVNNKLDEMAESGELEEIISVYLNSQAIFSYDSVSDMKSATNLINGSTARTLGYYSANDGGGSLYKIRQRTYEDVVDEKSIILINEDTVAELILQNNTLNIKQFGAKVDNETDDTDSIQKALDYISVKGGTLFIPDGTTIIKAPLEISSNTKITGIKGKSIIKTDSEFVPSAFKTMIKNKNSVMELTDSNDNSIIIENIKLDNNSDSNAGHDGLIQFRGVYNSSIKDVDISVAGDNCWGIILFSANKDININKATVINSSDDNSLGGCIWVRSGLDYNNLDSRKTTGIVIDDCYLESTAKDELLCIADGVAGGYTECKVTNTTIVGKATTTYSSNGIVVNVVGSNDSHIKTNIENIDIFGNFSNAGILHGSNSYNMNTTESTYNNINIELTNGNYGIRSYYKDQIFNNCYIKGASNSSVNNATITNSELYSKVQSSNVIGCYINATGVGCDDCLTILNSKIIATTYGIHTYGGMQKMRYSNNYIEADTYGIYCQPNGSTGAKLAIINDNIIKRISNNTNSGSIGIINDYGQNLNICNNIIYGSNDNAAQNIDGFQYLYRANNATNITRENNTNYQV